MPNAILPDYTHNQDDEHQLARVLRQVIEERGEVEASFASGFFDLGAWELLGDCLTPLKGFRLMLGKEPDIASPYIERVSLRRVYRRREGDTAGALPDPDAIMGAHLEDADLDPRHWALADGLIGFLRRDDVQVRLLRNPFLHAKAYLFPHTAIVGSSNFTRAGLSTNAELDLVSTNNAVAKDLLTWYDSFWERAEPYKDALLKVLEDSKFGRPYEPLQVLVKVLYERFGDTLTPPEGAGAVIDLARFQEEGLKQAIHLLERHRGVMVADAVGLGKTFIAMRIMEHYLIGRRKPGQVPRGLVVCPAQLRDTMWRGELAKYAIPAEIVSQEELGREGFDWRKYRRHDLVIVDESHNFRTPGANRYGNLLKLISAGRSDKLVVLLTATPINNSLWDLYNQLMLLCRGSETWYRDFRVPNLKGFFRMVDKGERDIFDLLDHTTVRRSRVDVRKRQEAGEKVVIAGEEVRFPERELANVNYDLTSAYPGVYHEIVGDIERLNFVPYNIARYRKTPSKEDEQLVDRGEALIGIQKVLFLKRLESSVAAFQRTVRRQQAFQRRFCELLDEGKLLGAADARKLRALEERLSAAEADDTPQDVRDLLDGLEEIAPDEYDLRAVRRDCEVDIKRLDNIAQWVDMAASGRDAKCERLKELLAGDTIRGRKALIFTYYRDTADHLYASLAGDGSWAEQAGNPRVERITGDTSAAERAERIVRFAPVSNAGDGTSVPEGGPIDILLCTDVLSEGQNLQDAGIVINYDLHWNPVRMIQRAGRVDRLRCLHGTVWIYNFYPEDELESLLRLVSRVQARLATMAAAGFLDASTLGEAVPERSMETIRRIRAKDKSVLDELERAQELASAEDMRLPLLLFIQAMGEEEAKRIPLGIHSGMRDGAKRAAGVFVAFAAGDQHFWRFCREDGTVERETRRIFNWILCDANEPRVLPEEATTDREAFRAQMLQAIDRATKDVLDELKQARGTRRVPAPMTGLNKRLFDALNNDAAARVVPADLRQMLNNVLRHIDLRPFAREEGLRAIDAMLKREYDIREVADKLHDFFVESEQYHTVGVRPMAEEIKAEDLKLVAYEVVW